MAISLAKKGLQVVLTYKSDRQAASKVVAEIENMGQKAISLPLDVSEQSHFDAFFVELVYPPILAQSLPSFVQMRQDGLTPNVLRSPEDRRYNC
ncbi:hypothetical protein [Galbibacter sp.]|uniref:hypothetical protein n=1 Tax=Galbibacter sp. TaxID=2918471 RepID=UPI003A90081C